MHMNHPELINLEACTDCQSTDARTAESEFCPSKSIRKSMISRAQLNP